MRKLVGMGVVALVAGVVFGQMEKGKKTFAKDYENTVKKIHARDVEQYAEVVTELDEILTDPTITSQQRLVLKWHKAWTKSVMPGKKDEALAEFVSWKQEFPDAKPTSKSQVNAQMGRTYRAQGKHALALEAFQAALAPKMEVNNLTPKAVIERHVDGRVSTTRMIASELSFLNRQPEANVLLMAALLEYDRIDRWQAKHQLTFDQIKVTAANEAEYRDFCKKLHFLILPVEENVQIKTLLRRIAEGQ